MLRSAIATLVTLLTIPVALPGQSGVVDPDGRRLTPRLDTLAIYLVRGTDTTRTGLARDEVRVLRDGGAERLQRIYMSADRVLGTRIDTIVDLLADLRPVRHYSRSDRSTEVMSFAAGTATGWVRPLNGDSTPVNVAAPEAYNSSSADLILRSTTLRAGWEATIPAFVPSTRAIVSISARVTGVEQIGDEMCWRIQSEFVGTPVTFWIGQTSRSLRQQVLSVRPGVQILFRHIAGSASTRRAT